MNTEIRLWVLFIAGCSLGTFIAAWRIVALIEAGWCR